MSRQKSHNQLGKFEETWMFQEADSSGSRPEKLQLPTLPPPWKAGWAVKGTRRYFRADRGMLLDKRVRPQAPTAEELVKKVEAIEREIQQHGALALSLSTKQRYEAAAIFIIAEELGIDALEYFQELKRKSPSGGNGRQILVVVEELIAKKRNAGRREKYVDALERTLTAFAKRRDKRSVASVTTEEIEDELAEHEWESATIHGFVQCLHTLFNYAIRRGYAKENPCKRLELPTKVHKKPEVLTVDQVRRLLYACVYETEMRPALVYVSVACFAGVRAEEMQRLSWAMFNVEARAITIEGEDAKCNERGIVTISDNLAAWLKPIAKPSGPLLGNFDVGDLRTMCRKRLGLERWPHDCTRHSFGSYHYTEHRNMVEVCAQMRHGTQERIFRKHYYVVVTPAAAAAFWQIFPPVWWGNSAGSGP